MKKNMVWKSRKRTFNDLYDKKQVVMKIIEKNVIF